MIEAERLVLSRRIALGGGDGGRRDLGSGETLVVPRGYPHSFVNAGNDAAEMTVEIAPHDPAEVISAS